MWEKTLQYYFTKCNFVSPGLQDDIVECDAKVTRTTKSLVFIEGNLSHKIKLFYPLRYLENTESIIIHKSVKADISFHIINLICFK